MSWLFRSSNNVIALVFIVCGLHVSGVRAMEPASVADFLPVPERLKNLKHYEFAHLRSHRQSGPSCMYSVLLNAQALTQALNSESKLLSSVDIAQRVSNTFLPEMKKNAAQYAKAIGETELFDVIDGDQSIMLAKHILPNSNFASLYMVNLNFNNKESLMVRDKKDGAHRWLNNLRHIKQSMLNVNKSTPYKHVFFSAPSRPGCDHAVLLTFIDRGDMKLPLIVCMDSRGDDTLDSDTTSDGRVYPGYVSKFLISLDNA